MQTRTNAKTLLILLSLFVCTVVAQDNLVLNVPGMTMILADAGTLPEGRASVAIGSE